MMDARTSADRANCSEDWLLEGGDGMAAFIAGSEEPLKHMTMREALQVLWVWVKRGLRIVTRRVPKRQR